MVDLDRTASDRARMARSLRIRFAGALYHVTSRGVARQVIFRDEFDYRERLRLMAEAVETHGVRMHAFTLMPNHDHIFLDTPGANLSVAMHDLNGRYAAYFNRRHGRVGHLFQGRFRAHVVESEGYYLEVSRYIHLNPVRAGLVERPEDWPYGSYAGYVRPAARARWVTYANVLGAFGRAPGQAARAYRTFVERGLAAPPPEPWKEAVASLVIGTEAFVEDVRGIVAHSPDVRGTPQKRAIRRRPPIEMVVAAVSETLGCDSISWRRGTRDDSMSRALAAWASRRLCGHTSLEIAARLGYAGPSSVSQAIR
jgi:putative transposase